MSDGNFGIGISGLAAAQAGLVATGHNIANANTLGYHRQSIGQSAVSPVYTGSGFMGQGVQVDTVTRAYSRFLDTQLAQAQAQASYYSAYNAQLSRIDNVVADTNAGLSPALQDFFSAAQNVATNPADMPSRQSLLSAGAALAARFNTLASSFEDLRSGVNSQLTSTVAEINSEAQQIAALNVRILSVQQNPNQPPNDLMDQRDALVSQLNKLVGTTVVTQSDGTINVVIGNGQTLVVGRQAMALTATPALDDPRRLDVGYAAGGNTVLLNSASLQGGSLGGVLAFRANDLDAAQNALGRVAVGLAQAFNDQHQLGQDLNGALGGNFFAVPAPVVIGKSTNGGNAVVTAGVSSAAALTTSDYRLTYTGANYTVTRLSDGTTATYASLPQTVDGVTITLASGAAAAGDSFLIQPTRDVARNLAVILDDPAAIAAAAPVRTNAALANAGSGTISAGTVNTPPPPDANLQQPVTLTFTSATTFNVTGAGTGNPVGVAYTPGADITYNGWTMRIAGTPAAGDVFAVTANTGGRADGRNALLLAGLQTRNTLAGGTTTFQGAYSQLVSTVGNKTRQIDITSQAQDKFVADSTAAQQSVSGVNLDEEAANLLRYQQAYQAAGKMIQIAQTLFQSVLELR
jgi:flagellar hook-associated protein 1 FlgK